MNNAGKTIRKFSPIGPCTTLDGTVARETARFYVTDSGRRVSKDSRHVNPCVSCKSSTYQYEN